MMIVIAWKDSLWQLDPPLLLSCLLQRPGDFFCESLIIVQTTKCLAEMSAGASPALLTLLFLGCFAQSDTLWVVCCLFRAPS